jgi:hypothetical protein
MVFAVYNVRLTDIQYFADSLQTAGPARVGPPGALLQPKLVWSGSRRDGALGVGLTP